MREIKFRGDYNGMFVYGNLINGIYEGKRFTQIENTDNSDFQKWNVREESVGEFSGLIDKNGKEVYEGDIIETDINGKVWEVKFENYGFVVISMCNKISVEEKYTFSEYLNMLKKAKGNISVIGHMHYKEFLKA